MDISKDISRRYKDILGYLIGISFSGNSGYVSKRYPDSPKMSQDIFWYPVISLRYPMGQTPRWMVITPLLYWQLYYYCYVPQCWFLLLQSTIIYYYEMSITTITTHFLGSSGTITTLLPLNYILLVPLLPFTMEVIKALLPFS